MEDAITDSIEQDRKHAGSGGAEYGNIQIPEGLGKNAMFKIKMGERVDFDIIPYEVTDDNHLNKNKDRGTAVKGSMYYYRPYFVHRYIGAGKETLTCPKTWGADKPCPICEYHEQLKAEGKPKDEYNQYKKKYWTLYAVVPIGHPEYEEEVKLFNIAQYNFQKRLIEDIEEKEQYRNFADIHNGFTLSVRFSKEIGKNGRPFAQATDIDFKEREYDWEDNILDQVPNLDDLLIQKSYEEMYNVLHGAEDMDEEEDDEEVFYDPDTTDKESDEKEEGPAEAPSKSPKTSKSTKQTKETKSEKTTKAPKSASAKKTTTKKSTEGSEKSGKTAKKTSGAKKTKLDVSETTEDTDQDTSDEKPECPIGLTFGRDWNSDDQCENCNIFQKCYKNFKENWKV